MCVLYFTRICLSAFGCHGITRPREHVRLLQSVTASRFEPLSFWSGSVILEQEKKVSLTVEEEWKWRIRGDKVEASGTCLLYRLWFSAGGVQLSAAVVFRSILDVFRFKRMHISVSKTYSWDQDLTQVSVCKLSFKRWFCFVLFFSPLP